MILIYLRFLADSGYLGIQNLFKNSLIPKKKSKLNPLTNDDKELNHVISSNRIAIEHVNKGLKIFKILASRYRNRRNTLFLELFLSTLCTTVLFNLISQDVYYKIC